MLAGAGVASRGQLTCSEYTIPFPKRLDVNCTLVAYLRFGVDMSVTRQDNMFNMVDSYLSVGLVCRYTIKPVIKSRQSVTVSYKLPVPFVEKRTLLALSKRQTSWRLNLISYLHGRCGESFLAKVTFEEFRCTDDMRRIWPRYVCLYKSQDRLRYRVTCNYVILYLNDLKKFDVSCTTKIVWSWKLIISSLNDI